MTLLFTILSTLLGAGINAKAFGGVSLGFSMLTDGAKERKRHDLAIKKLQRARDKWNEDQMKRFDFINKRLRERKMRQRQTSTMLMKQFLNTIAYLQKREKPLQPEPELSDFYHPSETQKMADYYLLQLVQVLQHMPYTTNTLNK